jgi:hypothetical protein
MNTLDCPTIITVEGNIGSGKSCSGILICESYKSTKTIIWVCPAVVKQNLLNEIRSMCTGDEYVSNDERNLLKEKNVHHHLNRFFYLRMKLYIWIVQEQIGKSHDAIL